MGSGKWLGLTVGVILTAFFLVMQWRKVDLAPGMKGRWAEDVEATQNARILQEEWARLMGAKSPAERLRAYQMSALQSVRQLDLYNTRIVLKQFEVPYDFGGDQDVPGRFGALKKVPTYDAWDIYASFSVGHIVGEVPKSDSCVRLGIRSSHRMTIGSGPFRVCLKGNQLEMMDETDSLVTIYRRLGDLP